MDARKVIFSFAVLAICAAAAFPQGQESEQKSSADQGKDARNKRYLPYSAYSTVHSYSYLTPYPNSIKSVQYAPPVYAAAPAIAAYHAPIAAAPIAAAPIAAAPIAAAPIAAAPIAAAYHAPIAAYHAPIAAAYHAPLASALY